MTDFSYLSEQVHWVNVKVLDHQRNMVFFQSWSDLPTNLRMKYDWYFRYIAALKQVKYPRYSVQLSWGNSPAEGRSLLRILSTKVSAKRGTITKYHNKLTYYTAQFDNFCRNYSSIIPLEEDCRYKAYKVNIDFATAKIKRVEEELSSLIDKVKSLNIT